MNPYLAVIDIGSNSARLVIYQQINSQEFHLIVEHKSPVRIGEGAYLKNGYLQPLAKERAYLALKDFTNIIQKYPISKTLCIATSALRDAPNKLEFIQWIKKELNLEIIVIDGKEEAKLGAIAALYLLPIVNGITIDIGGGSSDIAIIKNSVIVDTYSLNLGTVRLKELFSTQKQSIEKSKQYIKLKLKLLPTHFKANTAVSIGGTTRTLSKAIMKLQNNNTQEVHSFNYKIEDYQEFFEKILISNEDQLGKLKIPKSRLDTIKEGTLIWQSILEKIEANEVISSSVGVREGLFLQDINFMESNQSMKFKKPNN